MYGAIRAQQILQPANASATRLTASSSNPVVHRNRSLRVQPDRLTTLKRGSIRGLQSIITQSVASSNSSVDGRTSPSPSLATSAHEASNFLPRYRILHLSLTDKIVSLFQLIVFDTFIRLCF